MRDIALGSNEAMTTTEFFIIGSFADGTLGGFHQAKRAREYAQVDASVAAFAEVKAQIVSGQRGLIASIDSDKPLIDIGRRCPDALTIFHHGEIILRSTLRRLSRPERIARRSRIREQIKFAEMTRDHSAEAVENDALTVNDNRAKIGNGFVFWSSQCRRLE